MAWKRLAPEVKGMRQGDRLQPAQSHWIIARVYQIGQYSKYWSEAAQEAIGGPKWLYKDYIVKALELPSTAYIASSQASAGITQTNTEDILGSVNSESIIYFVDSDLDTIISGRQKLKREDLIYQIDLDEGARKPGQHVRDFTVLDRYKVEGVVPALSDNGFKEGYFVLGRRRHGEE